jgi:hypothetical protein
VALCAVAVTRRVELTAWWDRGMLDRYEQLLVPEELRLYHNLNVRQRLGRRRFGLNQRLVPLDLQLRIVMMAPPSFVLSLALLTVSLTSLVLSIFGRYEQGAAAIGEELLLSMPGGWAPFARSCSDDRFRVSRCRWSPPVAGDVEMAREGVPLVVIERQLGHANLGITSIYLQGIDSSERSTRSTTIQRPCCRQAPDSDSRPMHRPNRTAARLAAIDLTRFRRAWKAAVIAAAMPRGTRSGASPTSPLGVSARRRGDLSW